MITRNKIIDEAIKEMKEKRYATIQHKGFVIIIRNNNWPDQYELSVRDEGDSYVYEAHNYCKNDVMLYRNIQMILDYLGE